MTVEEQIEDDEYRSPQEIAKRAIVLTALIKVVFGEDQNRVFDWLKSENLWEELSPYELDFTKNTQDERACINISWRSEALVSLLWSINKIVALPALNEQVDFVHMSKAIPCFMKSTSDFIQKCQLRNECEIEDEYEKVFDAHWKVRDARLHSKAKPKDIDSGIVMERHHGFNYVIGYCGLPWDEITTDT